MTTKLSLQKIIEAILDKKQKGKLSQEITGKNKSQ
jgi:hypothetical protein